MTKKERLEAIIAHYGDGKPSQFAKSLGVAPSTISSWLSRDTFDYELLFAKCENINSAWLLTGEGDMLLSSPGDNQGSTKDEPRTNLPTTCLTQAGIPLIPVDAVAGFNGIDSPTIQIHDCQRYLVPEFQQLNAEFMIRVSGSSMYPKYSSGDILACRKLTSYHFIQWGKIYVIDSEQGAMVKRLFPCDEDTDYVICKSDNPNYPPFELPKTEIRSLSIVLGAIRFE
jgi:phage repressor protein C with HTH and peptisase S24 domain